MSGSKGKKRSAPGDSVATAKKSKTSQPPLLEVKTDSGFFYIVRDDSGTFEKVKACHSNHFLMYLPSDYFDIPHLLQRCVALIHARHAELVQAMGMGTSDPLIYFHWNDQGIFIIPLFNKYKLYITIKTPLFLQVSMTASPQQICAVSILVQILPCQPQKNHWQMRTTCGIV